MPIFDTSEPISVELDIVVGEVSIAAGERDNATVEVRPSDESHDADVRAAEQTRVEFNSGKLSIRAPKQRGLSLFTKPGSIEVTIELPTGSKVRADGAVTNLRSTGQLGDCRIKTATGDIELDRIGALDARTSTGSITVGHALGKVEVSGIGRVQLGEIDGSAVVKNANGDNWIGSITGDLRVNTANGDVSVDHAHANVSANTANGSIRVGDIVHGSVSLKTAAGEIEIGVHAGTAARLDVSTTMGKVRNELEAADSPGSAAETVDVRARTSYGDIVIRRATNS